MDTRKCSKCKEIKSLESFNRNKSRPLGREYICKICFSKIDRVRRLDPKRRAMLDEARIKFVSKGGDREYKQKQSILNPLKIKARRINQYAVRTGKLTRLPCEVCGEIKSEAHHGDYTKPLEVIWVCKKHHGEIHRIY